MTKNPSNNQLYIGVALKYLRGKKGYSQNTLAEITGMSVTTVNYIERARSKAKLDSLEILAEALDSTLMDMMSLGKELKMAEEPSLTEIVAENVKLLRIRKGFSQQMLAENAHVTVSYISKLERGLLSPTIKTVDRLVKALEIDAYELFEK